MDGWVDGWIDGFEMKGRTQKAWWGQGVQRNGSDLKKSHVTTGTRRESCHYHA